MVVGVIVVDVAVTTVATDVQLYAGVVVVVGQLWRRAGHGLLVPLAQVDPLAAIQPTRAAFRTRSGGRRTRGGSGGAVRNRRRWRPI